MAVQLPPPMNFLDAGAIDQSRQQTEWNALRNEAQGDINTQRQKQFSETERLENTKWLAAASKVFIEAGPQQARAMFPKFAQEAQRRGFPEMPVPPDDDGELMGGYQEAHDWAMMQLEGQPQPERTILKDVAGMQRDANTGERIFPDAVAPTGGGFGTTGSLQELNAINADRQRQGLEPVPAEQYLTERRQTSGDLQRYNAYVAEAQRGGIPPMSEQEYAATRAGTIAAQTAEDKGEAGRIQGLITQGQEVADGLPVLRRSLELLDVVATGGVLREAQLAFAKTLGIETADQGEISANLGKAVLSQLRETFGAQFTEAEGQRLIAIEAGFGKNNKTNRRLLGQAIAIVEAKAKRAIKLARDNGDEATAQIIEEMINMSLSTSDSTTSGRFVIEEVP